MVCEVNTISGYRLDVPDGGRLIRRSERETPQEKAMKTESGNVHVLPGIGTISVPFYGQRILPAWWQGLEALGFTEIVLRPGTDLPLAKDDCDEDDDEYEPGSGESLECYEEVRALERQLALDEQALENAIDRSEWWINLIAVRTKQVAALKAELKVVRHNAGSGIAERQGEYYRNARRDLELARSISY